MYFIETCGLVNGNNASVSAKRKKQKSELTNILQGSTPQKLIDLWTWSKNIGNIRRNKLFNVNKNMRETS